VQKLTYEVIRKFEDGARYHLSLSAWPRMCRPTFHIVLFLCF